MQTALSALVFSGLFAGCGDNASADQGRGPFIPKSDVHYIDAIVPHHRMAISMADLEIAKGVRSDVKPMAPLILFAPADHCSGFRGDHAAAHGKMLEMSPGWIDANQLRPCYLENLSASSALSTSSPAVESRHPRRKPIPVPVSATPPLRHPCSPIEQVCFTEHVRARSGRRRPTSHGIKFATAQTYMRMAVRRSPGTKTHNP